MLKIKTDTKKLLAYSASAVSLISISNESDAQAIYTDLDPDSVLTPHLDWHYTDAQKLFIDMDNDGHRDFKFLNLSYYHDDSLDGFDEFRQRIWAGRAYHADDELNFIAGSYEWHWSAYGYVKYGFPYTLSQNVKPTSDWLWNDAEYQFFVSRRYHHFTWWGSTISTSTADTIFYGEVIYFTSPGGHWYPEPGDTLDNKYLGVKFNSGIDNKTHYGWIRCSVIDHHEEGFELIVKDYAYESKPNRPIAAGDMIGDTSVIHKDFLDIVFEPGTGTPLTETNTRGAVIYSFEKTVYIYLPEELLNNSTIKIYNLAGESIFAEAAQSAKTEIDLAAYPASIYFVELITDEKKFVKKLWVE